jgi:NADPH:quinone reductase-like Zn-dependent oxidoreductase
MRAYELGPGFGFDKLKLVERPDPSPPSLGPRKVLVEWRAWSLNYRDLLVVTGAYNPRLRLPLSPLSDGAGEVVAVGPGTTRFRPGDRVLSCFMQQWIEGTLTADKARSDLGGNLPGVLTESSELDEEGLVSIPEHLSFEEAATLPCAALTAWNALVVSGKLQAGETVLLQGTGGVSLFALQFAKLHGAEVVMTSSRDDKLARAKQLGADIGINYKSTPEWGKRALEMGGPVDHVVEVGGGGTLSESLRAVRYGGHIALIGILSGAAPVNPLPILMKGVRVQGIYVGSRNMFEAMNRAIALHRIRPVIDRVFSFEEAVEALKYLQSAAHFGKVVIRR